MFAMTEEGLKHGWNFEVLYENGKAKSKAKA